MPKGLVVYLDDETYKNLKALSVREGKSLKDCAYDLIKSAVDKNQNRGSISELLANL